MSKAYQPSGNEIWWNCPQKWDVCWCLTCYTPPPRPGPAIHPVFVMRTRQYKGQDEIEKEGQFEALVAPGYTWRNKANQKITKLDLTVGLGLPRHGAERPELLLEPEAQKRAGLFNDTVFQVDFRYWAPFNSDFFPLPAWLDKENRNPRSGFLDLSLSCVSNKVDEINKHLAR